MGIYLLLSVAGPLLLAATVTGVREGIAGTGLVRTTLMLAGATAVMMAIFMWIGHRAAGRAQLGLTGGESLFRGGSAPAPAALPRRYLGKDEGDQGSSTTRAWRFFPALSLMGSAMSARPSIWPASVIACRSAARRHRR
jgi:hypothetical protein